MEMNLQTAGFPEPPSASDIAGATRPGQRPVGPGRGGPFRIEVTARWWGCHKSCRYHIPPRRSGRKFQQIVKYLRHYNDTENKKKISKVLREAIKT